MPMLAAGVLIAMLLGAWSLIAARTEAIAAAYRSALPEEIGVGALVAENDGIPLICHVVALCREVCGGAAFRLADETVAALLANGMEPLYAAKVGRGYRGSEHEVRYTYQGWQPTPVPSSWTSEGMWVGLSCLEDRNLDRDAVVKAAREPGAYFTTGSGIDLLVIPRMRMVVLTHER